jgi:tetratricopeptide (TPR) repeat protein
MATAKVDYGQLCDSPEDLVAFLADLPPEGDVQYSLELIALVEHSNVKLRETLRALLERPEVQAKDDLLFNVFYALNVYCRRMKYYSELEELVARFRSRFRSRGLLNVSLATMHKNRGSPQDMRLAIQYAKQGVASIGTNTGVLQNYADIVATAAEGGVEVEPPDLEQALACADKSIELSPEYAKYYCTCGRLYAIKGRFSDAKAEIARAIDLEDAEKVDYSIRISDYQYYLLSVKAMEFTRFVDRQMKTMEDAFEHHRGQVDKTMSETQARNLEFLAFFAAILSFTLGTLSLAAGTTFIQAASLVLVLGGTLLIIYSGFRLLIRDSAGAARVMIALMVLGMVLIVVGGYCGLKLG